MGGSTTALVFYNLEAELEVYIGNDEDITFEASNLESSGYIKNDKLLSHIRESNQIPRPEIKEGTKHYDIEEIKQGDKITACTIRSIHESHGKLIPNAITFAIEPSILNDEKTYIKALRWVSQRASAFSQILESEGMTKNPDFILNGFIYALENSSRLERFIKGDRGRQTITTTML